MGPFLSGISTVFPLISLLLVLPTVAWAGWGDDNWGEMVWGTFAGVDIPSMPVAALAILAVVLVGLSYWLLALQRKRTKRPPQSPS
jgi:hypothetical protein